MLFYFLCYSEVIRNPSKIFIWNCEKQNKFIERGRGKALHVLDHTLESLIHYVGWCISAEQLADSQLTYRPWVSWLPPTIGLADSWPTLEWLLTKCEPTVTIYQESVNSQLALSRVSTNYSRLLTNCWQVLTKYQLTIMACGTINFVV